jgi:hypothetical protein
MRTASGLSLVALGAILAFAVVGHPSFLNIQAVGWIVMLTGIVGMAIPRRGYGWLRRRMVLRRGPGGSPVINRVEEKHYPPYVMLNPGGDAVVEDQAPTLREKVPTVVDPRHDRDLAGAADPAEGGRLAAQRQAVIDRATAEWEAAEQASAENPGTPPPAEEVVEQYVEE